MRTLAVDRSSVRYRSVRPDDAEARTAMKAVAAERRRFGYRRIHVMLERQGIMMNLKKLRRLYREESRRRRGPARWAHGDRCSCRMLRTSAGASTSSATR
ncbi:MAG: IS3 family transposase [Rhodobacter sp.]|nr:IS3 family transposase [Rhodobacter sp.]